MPAVMKENFVPDSGTARPPCFCCHGHAGGQGISMYALSGIENIPDIFVFIHKPVLLLPFFFKHPAKFPEPYCKL